MNKKLAGIFAICALLLTGCQGAKESSKEITPPDTGWGKTVDEVLADWNLDRDQVEIFSETESAAAIAVDTEATVFGEKTSRVMFQFINLDQTGATGKPVLCEVDITYPDDADMDTVKKKWKNPTEVPKTPLPATNCTSRWATISSRNTLTKKQISLPSGPARA